MSVRLLAKQLGIHFTTVSKALRNDPKLRPETIQKIKKAAMEAGYLPDPKFSDFMRQLKKSSNLAFKSTLAYLLPSKLILKENRHYQGHWEGIREQAKKLGYTVSPIFMDENPMSVKRFQATLKAQGLSAVLFSGMKENPIEAENWDDFSVVTLGFEYKNYPSAHTNHYQAMLEALFQLDHAGYQRIGVVLCQGNIPYTQFQMDAAYSLYQSTVNRTDLVTTLQFKGYEIDLERFLHWEQVEQPEVILCDSDVICEMLATRKPRCDYAHLFHNGIFPGTAGIDQRLIEVGAAGVKLLVANHISRIKGESDSPHRLIVDAKWILGDSLQKKMRTRPLGSSLQWMMKRNINPTKTETQDLSLMKPFSSSIPRALNSDL